MLISNYSLFPNHRLDIFLNASSFSLNYLRQLHSGTSKGLIILHYIDEMSLRGDESNDEELQCQKKVLRGHAVDEITALKFSSSGRYLASGDSEGRVNIWNCQYGVLLYINNATIKKPVLDLDWLQSEGLMICRRGEKVVSLCKV